MSENQNVGGKIRQLREMKNITVEDLATRCGLDSAQISKIEEDTIMPSLAPLIKIARGLGVRLGTFLDDNEELGPVVSRNNNRSASISFSNDNISARKHMEYFSMASQKAGRHMEPFIIDIEKSEDKNYKLSNHEGEEFIFVMEGNVEIVYGKETYILEKGDSIYYDSIVNHHVHAQDGKTAKILAVIYTPF